jgi:hypothetical protein
MFLRGDISILVPDLLRSIVATHTAPAVNFLFILQVFSVSAIFVFRETRFFRNLGSFAKLRNSRNSQNSSLIFAKHENRFAASFAKRNFVKNPTCSTLALQE